MRYRLGLVFAALVAVGSAVLGLGGILISLGVGQHGAASSRLTGLLLAACFGLLLVLSARWAQSLEHRVRARNPSSPAAAPHGGYVAQALVRPGRNRHYSPLALTLLLLTYTAICIACAVGAVVVHGDAVHSRLVQRSGLADTGIVRQVVNHLHRSKSSTWYTSDITVQLEIPVGATTFAVVHNPRGSSLPLGLPVRVLLDPSQPAYAEFPGAPATTNASWIALAVVAIFNFLVGALSAYQLVHVRRRRRGHLAYRAAR